MSESTTENVTHAPIPFALGAECDDLQTQIIAADGSHVCYLELDDVYANAAFVVRAVNNHARLVAALSNLVDIAEPSAIGVNPDHDEAYYDAVAALMAVSP